MSRSSTWCFVSSRRCVPSALSHRPVANANAVHHRTATLVLAGLGAVGNAYAALHIVALWWTMRKERESEWEGSADIWTLDVARTLGALICIYMGVASVACAAGVYGTLKVCVHIDINALLCAYSDPLLFSDYPLTSVSSVTILLPTWFL